jgi:hypothetical protein
MRDLATRADADFSLARRLGLCEWGPPAGKTPCRGAPYYLSTDPSSGRIYVPFIFACSGIVSFLPGPNASNPVLDPRRHFVPVGWPTTKEGQAIRNIAW